MDVLLMAAGMGTRLGRRTRHVPKALVPVRGRSLVDYVLDHAINIPWIERVVIVTGCKAPLIRDHIGRRKHPKPVIEVFNPDYEKGNFYSLLVGLSVIGDEWLLMNVDHIYPRPLLERSRSLAQGVSAVCDRDRPLTPDCMKVRSCPQPDGSRAVVEIGKGLSTHDCGYIGLTFVSWEGRGPYMDAVARVLEKGDPDAVAEMVLQEMGAAALEDARASSARVVDASGFGWLEIDDETDLRRAEAETAQWSVGWNARRAEECP